jgi:DNA-binding NarL/FixJ family response regulator
MRVLLATDRTDLGSALRLYLAERCIELVDVVDDAHRLSARAASAHADVVIVDSRLAGALSTDVVADLRVGDAPTPVVILSTTRDQGKAKAAGADALAILGDPPDALLAALAQASGPPQKGTPGRDEGSGRSSRPISDG